MLYVLEPIVFSFCQNVSVFAFSCNHAVQMIEDQQSPPFLSPGDRWFTVCQVMVDSLSGREKNPQPQTRQDQAIDPRTHRPQDPRRIQGPQEDRSIPEGSKDPRVIQGPQEDPSTQGGSKDHRRILEPQEDPRTKGGSKNPRRIQGSQKDPRTT